MPVRSLEWEEARKVFWDQNLKGLEYLDKSLQLLRVMESHRRFWSKERDHHSSEVGVWEWEAPLISHLAQCSLRT